MNQIRAIQTLNKRELENGITPEASWHADYRDTAFVYFGGLPYELTEGDVITIFSQFGEPVFLRLARDRDTGASRGFGWLKYEDQRSTDLAVDNLSGTSICGRVVRVDHARYKIRDDEKEEDCRVGWEDMLRRERATNGMAADKESENGQEVEQEARALLKEERELRLLLAEDNGEDPMRQFLVEEKKKEVEEALRRERQASGKDREIRKRKHRDGRVRSRRSHEDGREEDKRDGGHVLRKERMSPPMDGDSRRARHRHDPTLGKRPARRLDDRDTNDARDGRKSWHDSDRGKGGYGLDKDADVGRDWQETQDTRRR